MKVCGRFTHAAALSTLSAALLVSTPARAEPERDDLRVSLLTMGPGDHPFFKFGHNALWVHDGRRRTDSVYNYGTFAFGSARLIPRFLRGRFDYWLSVQSLPGTLASYGADNRAIVAQELRMTGEQKRELVRFLNWNARDANKYYRYDYYLDNCTTRLRDLVDRFTGGRVRGRSESPASMTFREHTERLTADDWPIYLGLDVAMGNAIDRPIRVWDEMFLPEKLQETLRSVTVPTASGELPLVVSERTLVAARRPPPLPRPPRRMPLLLAVGAATGGLLAALGSAGARGRSGARIAYAVLAALVAAAAGLLGTLFVFLWAFTNHRVAYHNENILQCAPWALALPLLAVGVARGRAARTLTFYRVACAALAASALGLALKALSPCDQVNAPFIALLLPVWAGMTWGARAALSVSGSVQGAVRAEVRRRESSARRTAISSS